MEKSKDSIIELIDPSKIEYNDYTFHTYMVIDGVKHEMLWSDLEDSVLEHDMLFRDKKMREALFTVAPYLVKLEFNSEIGIADTRDLIRECYGHNSGIFLSTPLNMSETLHRLRDIFYITTDSGESAYLRFYEPVVFDELSREEDIELIRALFGNIYAYWCEDTKDAVLINRYSSDGKDTYKKSYKTKRLSP